MKERLLSSGETSLIIISDSEKVIDTVDNDEYLRHITPNLKIFRENNKMSKIIKVHLLNGNPSFLSKQDSAYVFSDYSKISQGQICHLIYHFVQKEFLKDRIFVMHAAGVIKDLESTVLIAPSKMGKTTFSLELALNHNFKIYGDDAIKIEITPLELNVIGGNTHLGLNSIHRENSKIKNYYPSEIPRYIDSEFLDMNAQEHSPLKRVIFLEPNIFDESYKRVINTNDGKTRLYKELAMEMRAAGHCLLDSDIPLQSLDNGVYSKLLIKTIKSNDIEIFSVSGSFKKILNYILEIVN